MKKTAAALSLCLLLSMVVWAAAAGGSDDPLVSLSHLKGTFMEKVERAVDQKLDASDAMLPSGQQPIEGTDGAATWVEIRGKQSDTLLGYTGAGMMEIGRASCRERV